MIPFRHIREKHLAGSLIRPSCRRLVLLTGQSDQGNSILMTDQKAFLSSIAPPDHEVFAHGFPYLADFERHMYTPRSLVRASLSNAHQFAAALISRRFQALVVNRIRELLDHTSDSLLVVTGSCGLQLLNSAWPLLAGTRHDHLRVIALGPVCVGRLNVPASRLMTIRGADDGWSRWLYAPPVDHTVPGGHLGYWTNAAAADLVKRSLSHRGL